MECDYRRVLDWWWDLLDSLMQCVTTLYNYHYTHTSSVHSHAFSDCCLVEASNGGCSPYSVFPNCPWRQLPASHSNSSQRTPAKRLKSKLCHDRWSVGQSVLASSTHLGLTTRFLLLSDSWRFVDVRHPLWQEDGSLIYNCCWSSPAVIFTANEL
jgi:hypothetical protein